MSGLFYEIRPAVLFSSLDYFYASIEQFDKPKWQNQPLVVVPTINEQAAVIGVSREAMEFGISPGMRLTEIKQLNLPVVTTAARFKRYSDVQTLINRKAETIFGKLRTFSLSEFAVDLEPDTTLEVCQALDINFKDFLVDEFGDLLTSSIGIAANDYLAKIAAQITSPDGFLYLGEEQSELLFELSLRELPGIGPKIADRLSQFDIKNMADLVAASPGELKRAWGNIRGEYFYHMLRGSREFDYRQPMPEASRRMTSTKAIPEDIAGNLEAVRLYIRNILTEGLQKARELEIAVGKLNLDVVYRSPVNQKLEWRFKQSVTLDEASNADSEWLKAVEPLISGMPSRESMNPSAVHLVFTGLVVLPEVTMDFPAVNKTAKIADRLEQIKALFLKPKEKKQSVYTRDGQILPVPGKLDNLATDQISAEAVGWVGAKYGWSKENFASHLLPLQLEALNFGLFGELRNKSGLVSAPTSAGKTFIAEVRMIQRFLDRNEVRRKTVMLVPTREIGRERWQNFERGYGTIKGKSGRKGLKICYSDGDLHQFDSDIWEANFDVAILVNEKFRFFSQNPQFLLEVGEIVFDEIAFLSESVRGAFLEAAILSVVSHPERPAILGLTHPTDDLKRILELLSTPHQKPFLLESDTRPIPIESGIWVPSRQKAEFVNSNTGNVRFEDLVLEYPYSLLLTLSELLKRYLNFHNNYGEMNNLVFAVPTKRMAIDVARNIAALIETDSEIAELVTRNKSTTLVSNRLKGLDPSRIQRLLAKLLPLGIGVHTADLSLYERKIVSEAFRESEIPILVCTSTMAYGVNLPAQSIIFINWGQLRGANLPDSVGIPFYETLKKDFIPWIGRVGRVGQPLIRPAESLYLCQKSEDTEEFRAIEAVIKKQKVEILSTIFDSVNLIELVLFAVNTIFHRTGKDVPEELIMDFFKVSVADQVNRRKIREILHNLSFEIEPPAEKVRSSAGADKTPPEETTTKTTSREIPEKEMFALNRYNDIFHITLLGRISAAHGVNPESCRILRDYLRKRDFEQPLDLLDIFSIALSTVEGQALRSINIKRDRTAEVEEYFAVLLNTIREKKTAEQLEVSPLFLNPPRSVHMKGTMLALRAWASGRLLLDIEEKVGFVEADANVQETARDFARVIRLFGMIAQTQPGRPKLRPEKGEVRLDRIFPEFDLEEISETVLFGLPVAASPLARLGIDSLSRAWIMRLKEAVEKSDVAPDLPLGERLRIIADENEPFIFENLPTKGLALRVAEALKNTTRQPLGNQLRNDPEIVQNFYSHPLVAKANLLQGTNRMTALKVMTRAGFAVFRRNEARGKPITIKDEGEFGYWIEKGAVEILAEIGLSADSQSYHTDRFLIDLDPRDNFPLSDLKAIAKEVYRRMRRHPWVDETRTYLHWTGGKGFHVVGEFKDGLTNEVEAVQLELEPLVASLCDDETVFPKPLTSVYQPHVVLDISPIMRRGVYRNIFSFHAAAGGICIPVSPEKLDFFDPDRQASAKAVLLVLDQMRGQEFDNYQKLVSEFLRLC